jgi:hypothetical protein
LRKAILIGGMLYTAEAWSGLNEKKPDLKWWTRLSCVS